MSIEALLPERIKLPFSNYDLWNSVETSGLLKATPSGIDLEYEVVE